MSTKLDEIRLQLLFQFLEYSSIQFRAGADFFSVRIINVWNQLSDEIVNASSTTSFHYKLTTKFILWIVSFNQFIGGNAL